MGLNTVISKAKDENTNKSNIHDGWECMACPTGRLVRLWNWLRPRALVKISAEGSQEE